MEKADPCAPINRNLSQMYPELRQPSVYVQRIIDGHQARLEKNRAALDRWKRTKSIASVVSVVCATAGTALSVGGAAAAVSVVGIPAAVPSIIGGVAGGIGLLVCLPIRSAARKRIDYLTEKVAVLESVALRLARYNAEAISDGQYTEEELGSFYEIASSGLERNLLDLKQPPSETEKLSRSLKK